MSSIDSNNISPVAAEASALKAQLPKIFQGQAGPEALSNMVEYAKICNSFPDLTDNPDTNDNAIAGKIIELIKKGEETAIKIEKTEYGPANVPTVEDVIGISWLLIACTAYPIKDKAWVDVHHQEHSLFTKGSLKICDPDHKLAYFFLLAEGQFHGQKTKIYPRASSHWIEDQKTIKHTPVLLPDGGYVCFSKQAADKIKGEEKKTISFKFDKPAIGIDLTGFDSNDRPLTPPGANTQTMMVMLLPDGTLGIKWEGYSAASITDPKHGNADQRIKDSFQHGGQFFKKLTGHKDAIAAEYSSKLREDNLTSSAQAKFKHLYDNRKPLVLNKELEKDLEREQKMGNLPSARSLVKFATTILEQIESNKTASKIKEELEAEAIHLLEEVESLRAAQELYPWGAVPQARLGEVVLPPLSRISQGNL